MVLLGFVAQKAAGVMSSFLREVEDLTNTAKLCWNVLPVSSPSSRKKEPPITL